MPRSRPISARSVGRPVVPNADRPQIGLVHRRLIGPGHRLQTDRARRLLIGPGRQLQIVRLIAPGRPPFIGRAVLVLGPVLAATLGVRAVRSPQVQQLVSSQQRAPRRGPVLRQRLAFAGITPTGRGDRASGIGARRISRAPMNAKKLQADASQFACSRERVGS
jgi:hypothetical protein